jgi:hypothetical protein
MIAPVSTFDIGGEPVANYGWIPPEARTAAENATNTTLLASLPIFQIQGPYKADKRRVALWEARQKIAGSKEPPYINQSTGSCVGAGGGNALLTLRDVEIALGGKLAEPEMIWWLYTYGESRQIAGMGGRGDGSTGTAWAKAITTKGTFAASQPGLPPFQMRNGWYYLDPGTERQWSDGQMEPARWDPLAAKHLVKTAAPCRSADDVAAAIQNGYPCTIAGMFGTRGPRLAGGDHPVLLAEWDGSWAHQMFLDEWWDHPTLGEIFRNPNNWGPDAHGNPPDGSPRGGFHITRACLERRCKQGEVFALSAFEGFPARELDWAIL